MNNVTHTGKPKRVANNTVRYETSDDATVWRLHDTDVVKRSASGIFTLNSGGWRTPTTKDRINTYAPVNIGSNKGVWYLGSVPFFDGMRVNSAGTPIDKPRLSIVTDTAKLKAKIAKFVKLIDTVAELPKPNGGDCWHCLMFDNVPAVQKNGSYYGLGSSNLAPPTRAHDPEHLINHMDEGYLHGSLLVNAMRFRGFRDDQIGVHYAINVRDTFKRALRHYLNAKLAVG